MQLDVLRESEQAVGNIIFMRAERRTKGKRGVQCSVKIFSRGEETVFLNCKPTKTLIDVRLWSKS